ncbi:glycosyltransferase [Flavobacterium sp.]|uniref:glycosyltransferase n=1 Tax=Flavobacterium sp. TaxID=239 RepID=UPI0028BEA298|nr:glycosyltransferase [Flavobacterium sp.]
MRILQLIDSLESGGAERMAVNFANAFAKRGVFSALIATRREGDLKESLSSDVNYLFLSKKNTFDFNALFKLRHFVKINNIDIVHAHGTSFFLAALLKMIYPKVKLFWHDHNGNRLKSSQKSNRVIVRLSSLFDGVICVNEELKEWAISNLKTKNVHYLPNFTTASEFNPTYTELKGNAGKRIICLANLREPKNHHRLVSAFNVSKVYLEDWTLHLVGRDLHDEYSAKLNELISENNLQSSVFIYGSKSDIFEILSQADIGILVSTHEGFPVTLLEYGLSKLAVIAPNVGYCTDLMNNKRGLLIDPLCIDSISDAIQTLVSDLDLRNTASELFYQHVLEEYSENSILNRLEGIFNND